VVIAETRLICGEKYLGIISQLTVKDMENQRTTGEQPVSRAKEEILKEASRIEEVCLHSAKGHFVTASFWSGFHHVLGLLTVTLAAIAGTAFFSSTEGHNMVAGIISLITAGLSAVLTFLNPNERATNHLYAGNSYDSLQNKTRIFRTIECLRKESEQVLSEELTALSQHKDRLNQHSPQPSWLAYLIARRGIEKGEGSYNVDKEKVANKLRDQVPHRTDEPQDRPVQ